LQKNFFNESYTHFCFIFFFSFFILEASSIHQKSSLNTANNISSQLIEKEAISKSLGQRSSKKLSSSTMPYIFSPETLQKSQQICDASRTQKSVGIFEGIEGPSNSVEIQSFSTAKGFF